MYCTRTDMEQRYPGTDIVQLCDDELLGESNPAIPARIDAAILDAATEIDLYLTGRGGVPSPIPSFVVSINCDLALFNLYKRRTGEPPKIVMEARRQAQRNLLLLQDGTLKFTEEVGLPPLVSKDDNDRIFPDSLLNNFR